MDKIAAGEEYEVRGVQIGNVRSQKNIEPEEHDLPQTPIVADSEETPGEKCYNCGADADWGGYWYEGEEVSFCDPCIRRKHPNEKFYRAAIKQLKKYE